jgi:hypothetical protein
MASLTLISEITLVCQSHINLLAELINAVVMVGAGVLKSS